jgi:hypothetical protein
MPMVDLRCPAGHEYEGFRHQSQVAEEEPCQVCGETAKRIYRYDRSHSYGGLTEPLVVWKRPDGTFAVPANRDAKKPPEYERVELRNAFEIRGVERAIGREEQEKWERSRVGKQQMFEGIQSGNRSELRSRMQSMSPAQRDFARFAMAKNNQKTAEKYRGTFYFEAMSQDSSNRDPYREDGRGIRGKK